MEKGSDTPPNLKLVPEPPSEARQFGEKNLLVRRGLELALETIPEPDSAALVTIQDGKLFLQLYTGKYIVPGDLMKILAGLDVLQGRVRDLLEGMVGPADPPGKETG